jgi:tripartite-type tricarboxylate transporter receptor subunit TctC
MNSTRTRNRIGSSLIGMLCVVTMFAGATQAQTYPSRPIEFVAQTSPGAGTDLFSRNITELLTKEKIFSQPLINANRVGGGGAIAYNYIKSKRGDPHVIMAIATGGVLNAASRPDLELPLDIFTPLATLGGHVETTGENMSEMLPLVESKKMRVLAVTGERRFVQAPDIPTAKELGYNIIVATGRGFSMPAVVPKNAHAAMEAALKRVYDSQAYKEYSHRNMFDNGYLDGAGFAKYLAVNRVVHEEFLRAIGVVK